MTDRNDRERRKLTFSQREGKVPLPKALEVGVLSDKFKNYVWHSIAKSIDKCKSNFTFSFDNDDFSKTNEGQYWKEFFPLYCTRILDIPYNEKYDISSSRLKELLKVIIFESEYHEVITFLEFILRLKNRPQGLIEEIEYCFQFTSYFIDTSDDPVCINPTTSPEMKENIKRSLNNINASKLIGTKRHLRNSLQKLNNKEFSDSIRESIHAVEAAAREFDPNSSKTLDAALKSLEKRGMLQHPVLKEAFKKLYGYTNDEQGLRHALIDKNSADVGFDEAIFMYSACVSFVDYLVGKHKEIKK